MFEMKKNISHFLKVFRSSHRRCSVRKGVLGNLKSYNFTKKETLAHLFFCGFCEVSKNTVFTEHLWATAFKQT